LLLSEGEFEPTDVTAGGQVAILETVRAYLRPVEYGENHLARLWRPTDEIALDPKVQAGRPCIIGTRVTTDVVASRFLLGEPRRELAEDLGLTVSQVVAATQFEQRLERGEGLALVP